MIPQRRKVHKGAVYIDFSRDGNVITTDAPPLLIHHSLSLNHWLDPEDKEDDETEEDELVEGVDFESGASI